MNSIYSIAIALGSTLVAYLTIRQYLRRRGKWPTIVRVENDE